MRVVQCMGDSAAFVGGCCARNAPTTTLSPPQNLSLLGDNRPPISNLGVKIQIDEERQK